MRILSAAVILAAVLLAVNTRGAEAAKADAAPPEGAPPAGAQPEYSPASDAAISAPAEYTGSEPKVRRSKPKFYRFCGEAARATGHYFMYRGYDLLDIVDFSFGAGPGILVNAHVTKLAQAGLGYSDMWHIGCRGRSYGIWREKRGEVGVSLFYWQFVDRERVTGWVESFRSNKMDLDTSEMFANTNDRAFLGIGAMAQVIVGANVNVRPTQIADFILGWLTIDVLDDDNGLPKGNKDL